MTSVLITGAAGFIGRRVWKVGEESGHNVVPVVRRPVGRRAAVLDLTGPLESLPRADWVFHLAGGYAGADAGALRRLDLAMAERLIEWGRRTGIRNWIFASAAEVYGPCQRPAMEDSPTRPVIPYGGVKLAAERMFGGLVDALPGSRVVILRIGEVYGREGKLIDELSRRFRGGFCPWFGSGDVPVSFVHVDDVARSFWTAARNAPSGFSVWNVADDEPVVWRQFLDHLAGLLGARRVVGLPPSVARLYAAASTARDRLRRRGPTLTRHIVTLLTTPKPLSNRRARDVLGLDLRYPEFRSGLQAIVAD